MKLKDIILAIFVAFAWGSYFTISKITLESFPPLLFGGLRFFLTFLFTFPFFFKNKIPILQVMLLSIITFFNLIALNYAINLSSNLAPIILINELAVPFSALLGMYFLKERFTVKDVFGIIIALVGLTLIVEKHSIDNAPTIAVILSIVAALLFASYNLLSKNLANYNNLTLLSQISLLISAQFFIASFWQEPWPKIADIQLLSILTLLYSAIICSLISYYIWFYLLNKYPLGKIVPFTLLSPIFGCLMTILTLNECISYETIFGGSLVIVGLIIIELKYVTKKL